MKVLAACEESQEVCKAFRALGHEAYSGIDRIDSSVGYEPNNVVSCCKICNYAKSNLTKDDFINWAIRVAEHSKAMAEQWGKY